MVSSRELQIALALTQLRVSSGYKTSPVLERSFRSSMMNASNIVRTPGPASRHKVPGGRMQATGKQVKSRIHHMHVPYDRGQLLSVPLIRIGRMKNET